MTVIFAVTDVARRRPVRISCVGIRVRALAITGEGKLVVIRRERAGRSTYRVFPGGGVQQTDNDEVSALKRELEEEISGVATVCQLVYSIDRPLNSREVERENFYVCQLHSFSPSGSGSEWKHEDPDNRYFVETIDMDEVSLRNSGLLPEDLVEMLVASNDPFALPSIDI
jgi:8-oxo-dGTP pyrophosphatase MutT (NUDIX family)